MSARIHHQQHHFGRARITHADDSDRSPAALVTVITTVFNREQYVGSAIESVLAQTWTDFQLIIVDDCSTDGSFDIVQRYAVDPRVRVIRNEKNLGDYANRNRAARLVRSEFFKFHDSDDLMYPHCLELMLATLRAEPMADFALTGSRSWEGGPVPMLLTPELAFEREFLGIGLFNGGPANALFRTRKFVEFGCFTDIGPASDHFFWMRYCAHHSVVLVNADLFFYRRHAGQEITTSRAAVSSAKLYGLVWRFLCDERVPLTPAQLRTAKSNWLWAISRRTWESVRQRRPLLLRTIIAEGKITVADWVRHLRRPRRTLAAGTPPPTRPDPD